MVESNETSGVKPFPIGGRMVRERERCLGMTDEERAWRKQYLKDQILSENEPRYVEAYWRERINPIRRFYRFPLDVVHKALTPVLGWQRAYTTRYIAGKALIILGMAYSGWYYFKYNQHDWTQKGGWKVISSRTITYPGDEGFPKLSERSKPSDYSNENFRNARI